jgi:hypothetical protein
MNRFFTCCLSLTLSAASLAQPSTPNRTYIGVDVAYVADKYGFNDPGGSLEQAALDGALWGINLRQVVMKYVYLETGVYTRPYKVGIAFRNAGSTAGTDRRAVLLPLRVGARLPLFKEKLTVSPVVGYVLALANEGQTSWSYGDLQDLEGNKTHFDYTVQYPTQAFSLLQAGLAFDIPLWPKTLLSINTGYYQGLDKILIQHITYSMNNGPETTATAYTKGSFYSIGIGLRYQVGGK